MDRWVKEAADGTVDQKTQKPAAYEPFYGDSGFVRAMWEAYRPKADQIGAELLRKAGTGQ